MSAILLREHGLGRRCRSKPVRTTCTRVRRCQPAPGDHQNHPEKRNGPPRPRTVHGNLNQQRLQTQKRLQFWRWLTHHHHPTSVQGHSSTCACRQTTRRRVSIPRHEVLQEGGGCPRREIEGRKQGTTQNDPAQLSQKHRRYEIKT